MLAAASGYRFDLDLNHQLGMGQKRGSYQGGRWTGITEKFAMGAQVSCNVSGCGDIRSDANRMAKAKPEMGKRCADSAKRLRGLFIGVVNPMLSNTAPGFERSGPRDPHPVADPNGSAVSPGSFAIES